ncbi:MAG: tyrosine-type recombinase/integrase [Gemmatimonadales bacterium]|jgi:integrase|nr:tyrosine-type recombinase/integrase [Gemmatimonadales bacterium]
MLVSAKVRVTGPLTEFVPRYAAHLAAQGYTDLSLANQLRLLAHLSRWLGQRGLSVAALSSSRVRQFVAARRRSYTGFVSERALRPLLTHLRGCGALPAEATTAPPRVGVLGRYERYLIAERPVLPFRREYYLAVAAEFLAGRDATALTAADVTAFVDAQARRAGLPGRLTALRSWLRFVYLDGITPRQLVYAVPAVPGWRQATLPKALDHAQLQAVLATCDRRTATGCRNYAALLLMGRLGLRAGEVAALSLDDVDWHHGEVVVRGKGGSVGRLPLPHDVGQALVAHLRRRRRRDGTRAVFVRAVAPHGAVTASAIIGVAKHALRAAGIPSGGAHRLRHTAATLMLRRGASLTEIAQVLRHRHLDTTAIYAKVDHEALHTLARPWPSQDSVGDVELRRLASPWPGGVA